MIELGQVIIRDDESSTLTRVKLLGLLTALGAGDVLATRIATALSEVTRMYVLAGVEARCRVVLNQDDTGLALEIRLAGPGRPPDLGPLRVVNRQRKIRCGRRDTDQPDATEHQNGVHVHGESSFMDHDSIRLEGFRGQPVGDGGTAVEDAY